MVDSYNYLHVDESSITIVDTCIIEVKEVFFRRSYFFRIDF